MNAVICRFLLHSASKRLLSFLSQAYRQGLGFERNSLIVYVYILSAHDTWSLNFNSLWPALLFNREIWVRSSLLFLLPHVALGAELSQACLRHCETALEAPFYLFWGGNLYHLAVNGQGCQSPLFQSLDLFLAEFLFLNCMAYDLLVFSWSLTWSKTELLQHVQ